ncbi:MAG: chemotaxis protein CheA [Bryobacteraceae bacterium]|nr:chemotaxis protein CheA [Bryobacteraceae bacterium]
MTERETAVTTIAERIEVLRTELAQGEYVTGDVSRWVQSLVQLSELARSFGNTDTASFADELAAHLQERIDAEDGAEFINGGLAKLTETLLRPMEVVANAVPSFSLAQDPELVGDFIMESREHLSSIEEHLLRLERGEDGTEAVHSIFRSFHTIKGLAGFLEFALIQEVAHEVESLLDMVRQGEINVTPAIVDAVLESRDYLGKWLTLLESGAIGQVPAELADPKPLIARIHASTDTDTVSVDDLPLTVETGDSDQILADPRGELSNPEPSIDTAAPAAPVKQEASGGIAKVVNTRAIKVSTDKLDSLVDMVGEMVIAQSLIRHDPELTSLQSSRLMRNLAQLGRITNDVQRTAMSMRMVPVGTLFQKMARLVRDLSRKFGKRIEFETQGDHVELDRNIVEELGDPMMHMVRNAIDHGIETEADRLAAGKSDCARIGMKAFHRAGQIVIEVSDDGRGIDRARVLNKARQKGLINPGETLSDAETLALIFQPGFSTVENVSDISGRGVGMDVVRKQITRLRGNIEIVSVPGKGTTFSLKVPLTLAIIDGLVVVVGEERFIIPLASVRELLRPKPEMLSSVENQAEMVCIRDQLLPMVRLYNRFGVTPRSTNPAECVLVVADADGTSFCLMVDEMAGKQEVVIKSLGRLFQNVAGVAGGAILGDGRVGLILDLKTLFGGRKSV